MSYATQDDLVGRFTQAALLLVVPLANDPTQLDSAAIAKALDDADALIDLNVRARYATPLTPVPTEIVAIACALARYGLYSSTTNVPEPVKDGLASAMALLVSIRDGDAPLECAPVADTDPAVETNLVLLEGEEPVMTGRSLRGF